MVETSDKMWSTGEENGKPLQYSCLENPMNNMKRQKDIKLYLGLKKQEQFHHITKLKDYIMGQEDPLRTMCYVTQKYLCKSGNGPDTGFQAEFLETQDPRGCS